MIPVCFFLIDKYDKGYKYQPKSGKKLLLMSFAGVSWLKYNYHFHANLMIKGITVPTTDLGYETFDR